jgi:hypothetical protein
MPDAFLSGILKKVPEKVPKIEAKRYFRTIIGMEKEDHHEKTTCSGFVFAGRGFFRVRPEPSVYTNYQ